MTNKEFNILTVWVQICLILAVLLYILIITVAPTLRGVSMPNIIKSVSDNTILHIVSKLTSIPSRDSKTEWGQLASLMVISEIRGMSIRYDTDIQITTIPIPGHRQFNVVAKLKGRHSGNAVVIGSHMDTTEGFKSGADDNASGCASNFAALEAILQSRVQPEHDIYFIFYGAEEKGLLGSKEVVKYFTENQIDVRAVLNLDMTGYRADSNDPTMWLYIDNTDYKISGDIAQWIPLYIGVPVKYSRCGYKCSDHASWDDAGIPAAMVSEQDMGHMNPYIHTDKDTIEKLNIDHMRHFSQLAAIFALVYSDTIGE